MANQAIALQARAPQQSNILGGALQQGAQMINMMSQQRSAERQAAAQQQEMKLAQEKAGREATQAEIDNAGKLIDLYTKRAGQTLNAEGYGLLLRDMDRDAPEIAAAFRANLPPERFDRNVLLQMVGSIGDNFKATFGPLETEVVQDENGDFFVSITGGFGGPKLLEIPGYRLVPKDSAAAPAQAAAPGAPAPAPSAFPKTAAPATDEQIDEAARKILRGAGVAELGIGAEDFDRASARANQMSAGGGGRMQPISMTTGAQMGGQPDMTAVVQDMMSSGQISQSNLQLMREMAGPDKDAQLAQILKTNNIQIVPDEQPGMRSAVFRPGQDAAPQMQLAQSMDDYVATGRGVRGKPPMQSPLPGSAQVPIERVRQEAAAGRETAEEVYAKERARRRAERDALKEAGPKPLTPVQEAKLRENIAKDFKSAQATLDMMLAPDSGVIAAVDAVRKLSSEQKEAITGFSGYVPSVLPSSRSADTVLKNLQGKVTQMGKSAASLGGAIGQMAVQEWKIVSDMIAALDVTGMEPADLDNQLDIIEATARRAAQTTRDAYENQYAEEFARYPGRFMLKEPRKVAVTPGKKAEGALPRVRTDADYARLKPGTVFIDPDGQRRRKP